MDSLLKSVNFFAIIIMITAMLGGCGEEREDNVPAVKLTASAAVSEPAADGHGHSVEIPFTDLNAAASTVELFQYRSSDKGHSHVIALSKLQMIDLGNGLRISVISSAPSSGAAHTHIWNILGGNVLYDKNCYNCHTNDKRGKDQNKMEKVELRPLSVASQIGAVINPGGEPLSTAAAAIPDPLFTSSAVLLDGPTLYASNCSSSSCHGSLASSAKSNRSFAQIKGAITNNSGGMASLGTLTDAQLQAIATALIK